VINLQQQQQNVECVKTVWPLILPLSICNQYLYFIFIYFSFHIDMFIYNYECIFTCSLLHVVVVEIHILTFQKNFPHTFYLLVSVNTHMCVHGNQYKHVCINKSVQLLV